MMRLRSLMLLSASSFGLAAGCNAILGNEEGTLRGGINGEGGASDASVIDGSGSVDGKEVADATFDAALTCPSDKKACKTFNACVTPTDPNFGCGDPSCNACDTTNAQSVVCAGIDGGIGCKLTCNPGFADCDGKGDNGCEADLSKAATCGSCGNACSGLTSLCANNGAGYSCVATCPGAQTKCGSECVDLTSHASHCGGCNSTCPTVANAQATCTSSKCGFECEVLFHQCGGQCVKDSDVNACGASCSDCAQLAPPNTQTTCQKGVCNFQCAPGWGDCNGSIVKDGCEADLYSDNLNCGKCFSGCGGVVIVPQFVPNADQYCCNGSCVSATQLCAILPRN